MQLRSRRKHLPVAACLAVLALFPATHRVAAQAVTAEGKFPQVVSVKETFDGRPFEYRIESRTEKAGYVVYGMTYPSPVVTSVPQNNTVPAEYYVPEEEEKGSGTFCPEGPEGASHKRFLTPFPHSKRPAVICIHILDGNMELVRMQCTILATHGVPAILFKLPYYGERGFREGPRALAANPALFFDALAQGMQDARRTIDVLASRPEIDPRRIGITGISLGGIAAAAVAESEPRLWRVMPILAGGDLLAIIHHARETAELSRLLDKLPAEQRSKLEAAIRQADPLTHAAALRDRASAGRVLMINAAEDEVIPRACTDKLASALGLAGRVEWLDGLGHYTSMAALPRVVGRMVDFFGQDLPADARRDTAGQASSATRRLSAAQAMIGLLQDAIGFLTNEPAAGRCHFADLAVEVTPTGQKPQSGRVLLVCGSQGRFKLQCKLPVVGDVAIGQGTYLWMASTQKTLFRSPEGRHDPGTIGTMVVDGARPLDPLAFAPDQVLRLRMLAGVIGGAALAPDVLDAWVAFSEEPAGRGQRSIGITLKEPNHGTARLVLKDDGRTPESLSFEVPGATGTLRFLGWQMNTAVPQAIFDPPAGLTPKEVPAEQLQRMFSAMFKFAMEKAE